MPTARQQVGGVGYDPLRGPHSVGAQHELRVAGAGVLVAQALVARICGADPFDDQVGAEKLPGGEGSSVRGDGLHAVIPLTAKGVLREDGDQLGRHQALFQGPGQ